MGSNFALLQTCILRCGYMSAKGSKTCCCNGCEKPPTPNSVNLTFVENKSWQTNCCSCVPEYACLTVIKRGTPDYSDTLVYSLYCPTTALGLDQPLYKTKASGGSFLVNGVKLTVSIHFYVRDGVCYLCFLCPELGLTKTSYDNCVTIDEAARATPNFFCKRLSNSTAVIEEATDRYLGLGPTSAGVGTVLTAAGYDFVLSRADHVSITPRPNCLDAYGNQVIDTSLIKDHCCNCSCICRCACLTKRSTQGSSAEIACLDEYAGQHGTTWTFPSGAVVSLSSTDYDKNCYLSLHPDVDGTATTDVLLGTIANKCPRPTARWETVVPAYGSTPSYTAFYEFACSGCGDSACAVEIVDCCSNGRTSFPRVLYADMTTTCPDCPSQTIAMHWDSSISQWIGSATMCGHAVELKINCPFTTLNWSGSPCFSANPSAAAGCAPILAVFSFSTGGIGCCGGSSLINPDISVTVYE